MESKETILKYECESFVILWFDDFYKLLIEEENLMFMDVTFTLHHNYFNKSSYTALYKSCLLLLPVHGWNQEKRKILKKFYRNYQI